MRRTKIVCTIGPASDGLLEELISAGMDVARLNFSHGTLEEQARRIIRLREASAAQGRPIGILLDIQGPKVRIGPVRPEPVLLESGQDFTFVHEPVVGDGTRASVTHVELHRLVQPGSTVYLDDGLIELRVERVEGSAVHCRVVVGGWLRSHKGLTLPGVDLDLPALTESDAAHIRFGIEQGVDFIAASFIRRAEHVTAVKEVIRAAGGRQPVIAKIESHEGVRHLEEIVAEADGIMVARGDLGVQIPPEEVPLVQKRIIDTCNRMGKPVITATQMLESMVNNPRPTRAEVTDVATAILDGTDAIMLSGETAIGQYPVQAVRVMDRVARRTENAIQYDQLVASRRSGPSPTIAEAISYATCRAATDVGAAAILTSTQSGATARMVSKFRPGAPILALTPGPEVARQLTLVWGVQPIVVPRTDKIDDMIDVAVQAALSGGYIRKGDRVVITAGVKTGEPGSTNLLQVYTVDGDARGPGNDGAGR
ncbi:MAG: pyruvate kinase [Firmicutes bacterium ZCTH02-B6]|nr:MAG: pyruvate kinase [Firmicutes bacterium ZCTH02-B6]